MSFVLHILKTSFPAPLQELLALEERIGNVSTGLSEETILKQLKQRKYVSNKTVEVETEPCCVCQVNHPSLCILGFCKIRFLLLLLIWQFYGSYKRGLKFYLPYYLQEEYGDGEDLGSLDCGHDFHAECIKQWLTHKNLCPICKTTGLAK